MELAVRAERDRGQVVLVLADQLADELPVPARQTRPSRFTPAVATRRPSGLNVTAVTAPPPCRKSRGSPPVRSNTRAIPSAPPVTTRVAVAVEGRRRERRAVRKRLAQPAIVRAPDARDTVSACGDESDPSRENATSTATRAAGSRGRSGRPPPDPERPVQARRSHPRPRGERHRPSGAVWRPTSERVGSTADLQTRAEPSSLAVTTLLPSGVNIASSTSPEWPSTGRAREASPPQMRRNRPAMPSRPSAVRAERDADDLVRVPAEEVNSAPVSARKIRPPLSVLAVASRLPYGDQATSRTSPPVRRTGAVSTRRGRPRSWPGRRGRRWRRVARRREAAVTICPGWSRTSGAPPPVAVSIDPGVAASVRSCARRG